MSAAEKRKQHRSRLQRGRRNNSTVFGSTADFASVTGMTKEEAAKYEERAAQKRDEDYEKNATPEERDLDDFEHKVMEKWVAEAKKKTDEKQKMESSLADEIQAIQNEKMAQIVKENPGLGRKLGTIHEGVSTPAGGGSAKKIKGREAE